MSNAIIAVIALIVCESMLFAGLVGAFLVFRLSAPAWPPGELPHLPLGITTLNTVVLLASLFPLGRALRNLRAGSSTRVPSGLRQATGLGAIFLLVQGAEWIRLVHHGLTLGSSLYGATFYLLIGCHALHVAAAVIWLTSLAVLAQRGGLGVARITLLETATVYWYFVCGLWLVLFGLVYLY